MSNQPPKHFTKFTEKYPEIAKAYYALGDAVHGAGPLDEKTRAFIKIALSGGAKTQGAFHSHVRKARQLGISFEEIRHVVLIALPTIGFPNMMALMSWIDDVERKEQE
ncbi:MAG: carboxymuconolactone decarboxylase family protein [Bacteroidota bacterium]